MIDEKNVCSYEKQSHSGKILEKYVREPDDNDQPSGYERGEIIPPTFHGQWRKLTQEELDELNSKKKKEQKIKEDIEFSLDEETIKYAKKLLQELMNGGDMM